MADWIKCTDTQGRSIFVNLAPAMSMHWNDHERCNIIAYPGGPDEILRVREKPNEVFGAERIDRN